MGCRSHPSRRSSVAGSGGQGGSMWEQSLAELWCKTARLGTACGRAVCGWYVECVCVCVEYSYVGTVWVVWLRRVCLGKCGRLLGRGAAHVLTN